MTIQQLIDEQNSDIRDQTAPNSITKENVTTCLTDITNELLTRGFTRVATTADLVTVAGDNFTFCNVDNYGLFYYSASGTPNGTTIFAADVTGTWNLYIWSPSNHSANVNQVTNANGSLTISPTTGNVVASLNLAFSALWTAVHKFSAGVTIGSSASPTALLLLAAGVAAANGAPLKFTSGTNLTTPENGAIEFNGTHLYITISGTRYQLDQQGGISTGVQYDLYESIGNSTWNKPTGAKTIRVVCISGGSGGGGGCRRASGTATGGAGGGASGMWVESFFDPASISSSVTVTVGDGGAGGNGATVNDTNGSAGSVGDASYFGSYIRARANSSGGAGGSTGSPFGGVALTGTVPGINGKSGTSGSPGSLTDQTGPGASGGGISTTPTAQNGGANACSWMTVFSDTGNTVDGQNVNYIGFGQGGRGGNASTSAAGSIGSKGGKYGAGGGGGGNALNGNNGGNGGKGGQGCVLVITWF